MRIRIVVILLFSCIPVSIFSQSMKNNRSVDPFLDTLEQRTFNYFWETVDPATGLTPDRYPSLSFSSIAAIGFSLTAYGIGAERGYVTREAAADRVLTTLKYLWSLPQGDGAKGYGGYRGFFYHFLTFDKGARFGRDVDLSSMDTALLMNGVLFSLSYFDRNNAGEKYIRAYADSLYRRVEWSWMQPRPPLIAMGWYPEKGYHHLDYGWKGYDEAMLLYLLALGSPTHPVAKESWDAYTNTFQWVTMYGYECIDFAVLFWNQFTASWIDVRGIQDDLMKKKGIDYFENSRRSTYVNQEYAIANPKKQKGYSALLWGISACDGPGDEKRIVDGEEKIFGGYGARGFSSTYHHDDGTLTPYAAGASIVFTPEISIPTLKAMREQIPGLWTKYGFKDAFNLTYVTDATPNGWVDVDYLGIDQGPLLLMIENYRSELVWNTMKKNPYIVAGLQRAGFTGGWLDGKK